MTWQIDAVQGATVSGHLVLSGTMTVRNTGQGGATIGNIVVNLQERSGNTWVSRSADVADATHDDAATSAKVVPSSSFGNVGSFTENAASGALLFMDATNNTLFSLVPEVTIQPGQTRTLLFNASFDNNVLNLAQGTQIRSEVIVSFGNANVSGGANIDINGNGIVDSDEVRVNSVASRLSLTVPAQEPSNPVVTLSDTAADIATTGTVTYSNAQFNIGATSGTVSLSYDGGTSGGTVTNCAHLTSPGPGGLNLTTCDTRVIGPHVCSPGRPGCGWKDGEMVTYTQEGWDAGSLLPTYFDTLYPFGLEVGIPGAAGFSMAFSDLLSVQNYLPAGGLPGALNADLANPTSSSSGIFGGLVVALKLNVDFSDANLILGSSGLHVGDLLMCGFTAQPAINGMTVRQFLGVDNTALGGGTALYPVDQLAQITFDVDGAFSAGAASTFAETHLFTGSCP